MTDRTAHHEVARADGIGTTYVVTVSGVWPDNRFHLSVSSGGSRRRHLLQGVSWTEAMQAMTAAVADELRSEGAASESVDLVGARVRIPEGIEGTVVFVWPDGAVQVRLDGGDVADISRPDITVVRRAAEVS